MAKKYICYGCGDPCILEVEKDADKPDACPYNEPWQTEWELMKEED